MKRILSKSGVNLFLQCPYKWKKCYIDKIRSKPSIYQTRGINIHSKIEKVYNKIELVDSGLPVPKIKIEYDDDLKHLIEFEKQRIKSCVNEKGEFDMKYFRPLAQELKLHNDKMGMRGIVDAVYINPGDDGLIVLDWKTGKYYGNKLDDYRFELAVYAEMLRAQGKYDNIKYWAIYFTDQNKLFFEKIDMKYIIDMYKTVAKVRKEIEAENFEPKKNEWCWNCDFKKECPLMGGGKK